MKYALSLVSLIAVQALAAIPAVPQYKFSFVVQSEHDPLVRIDAALPLGTTQELRATEKLRIEVQVPASTNEQSHTVVRLIEDSSGHPVVLHRAETGGSIAAPREIAYLVCKQQVTYISPMPSEAPVCPN
jgi:hypothetical protein